MKLKQNLKKENRNAINSEHKSLARKNSSIYINTRVCNACVYVFVCMYTRVQYTHAELRHIRSAFEREKRCVK